MNIKGYTGRVLAICTITGFTLGSGLVFGYRNVEEELHQLGPNSIALQELDNLETQLGWYLLSGDLVLKDKGSYMLNATLEQSRQLLNLSVDIGEAPLAADKRVELEQIYGAIVELQSIIDRAAAIRGEERVERLEEMAREADVVSTGLVGKVQKLKEHLLRRARYNKEDLEAKRSFILTLSWFAAGIYIVVVLMAWFWTVQTLVRPIETLSDAAERAQLNNESVLVDASGPEEVQRLTRNIAAFARTRTEFLATMSHELRTPLNGIINMNEMMLETELNEEQREFAHLAKGAGEALLGVINQILDFTKIEAKKLELEQVRFDLHDLVDGVVEMLSGAAQTKDVALEAVIRHGVPSTVVGDPTRLRQVLVNLVSNAVKFTAEGGVAVTVSLAEASVEGGAKGRPEDQGDQIALRCEVRDSGMGIPKEALGSLFQAFQQVDSSTTRTHGGTGLGLAICKELTALMGGEIGVVSEVGAGSTFSFTIRLGTEPSEASDVMPPLPDGLRDGTVVLLSRRERIRERIREQLLMLGWAEEAILEPSQLDGRDGDRAAARVADGGVWAVVDPAGLEGSPWDAVQALPLPATPVVGVLEHPLRRKQTKLPPPPFDVDTLPEPTKPHTLLDWFAGRLSAADDATGKPVVDEHDAADSTRGADGADAGDNAVRRVLVAIDNPIRRRLVCRALEGAGADVTAVADGPEAVKSARELPFEIVVIDCDMPSMRDFAAVRRLRRLQAKGQLAPGGPEALTIIGMRTELGEGGSTEIDAVVGKPLQESDLLEAIERLARAAESDAREESTESTAARRILVVDDNPMNQRVACAILKKAGYEVSLMGDGQQAVDALSAEPYDLVLMDCQMPVLDGWEATRVIRQLESVERLARGCPSPLPIIAVTANAMEGDREKCLGAGMDDYLTKPLRPQLLLETIERFLAQRSVGAAD